MKKIITLLCAAIIMAGGMAVAHDTGKPHSHPGDEPQGGGYYDGKYHIQKKGTPKKKLLRWDGFNDPIKEMKEDAKKPPSKLPSQSTDK